MKQEDAEKIISLLKIELKHLRNDFTLTRQEYESATKNYLDLLFDFKEKNKQLEDLKEDLEKMVAQRTSDLKSSEEKYRTLTENMKDVVYSMDNEGVITYVSPQIARYGFKPQELESKQFPEFIMPEDREKTLLDFQKTMETGEEFSTEFRIKNKKNKVFWFEERGKVICDESGSVSGIRGVIRDITERKLAEEAQQESEEKVKSITLAAQDAIIMIDEEGLISFWNLAAEEMLGYSQEEILGQVCHKLLAPKRYQKDSKKGYNQFKQTGEGPAVGKTLELSAVRKDGTEFPIELSVSSVRVKGKWHAIGIMRDINERKQMDMALKESQRKLESIIRTVPDIIYRLDPEGRITFISGAVTRYGYFPEEMLGKHMLDFVSPEDKEKAVRRLTERRTGDRRTKSLEIRLLTKDRISKEFEVLSDIIEDKPVFLIDAEGVYVTDKSRKDTFIGTQGIARDITLFKRTGEALRESEERYRTLVETSQNLVFRCDLEGRFTYLNQAWEHTHGYKIEEILGRKFTDFQQPEVAERDLKEFSREIEGGETKGYETTHITKSGKIIHLVFNVKRLLDKDGQVTGTQGTAFDISERIQLEEERMKISNLESLGILAGGIAHDFNNILTAVLGNISLASFRIGKDKEVAENLADAEKACLVAKDLTGQFITFSRGGTPVKKSVMVTELIKNSATFVSRGSNVRCEFSLSKNLLPAEVDPGQIQQVINNIVLNAVQSMPESGVVEIAARNVTVGAGDTLPLKEGKYIKISVKDQGCGIPEEILPKIFDPYFSTKNMLTKKGSGLGLTTAYSIIKRHDGHILVKSKVGAGTAFYVYLPVSGQERETEETQKVQEEIPMLKGKILVMDDREQVRKIAGNMLKYLGHEMEFAKDGDEAIELYKRAKDSGWAFDSVILDLTIPGGMGGRQAIEKLLEIDPEVKAIVSSGYSDDPVVKNYKKYGFCGILSKPYEIEELKDVIQGILVL
jgi:PAS domain S-box-containing protein